MATKSVVVVGGGAAGFFGAIRAKSLNPSLDVVILEAAPKCLGKVKISGGGRCNVTHACFDIQQLVQSYPRGHRELKGVFARFGPQDTVNWFESHGVRLKTEADGRMFPVTDDAQTIIDCLLGFARGLGIHILTKHPVQSVGYDAAIGYTVVTPHGNWHAPVVLLAPGSSTKAYAWTQQLGHSLIPPVPSLFTFNIKHPLLADLAGISFPQVKGTLQVSGHKDIAQEGPLLITHWGLSGPVVLRLSAWGARPLFDAHYQATLLLDFFPTLSQDTVRQQLLDQKAATPKKHVASLCPLALPRRFWERMLGLAGLPESLTWGNLSGKSINHLAEQLKRTALPVQGKGVFKEEFVTAGGIPLSEIDMKTMASRCCPGLYFAGEIIDVDGLTGGFNFQNAWSTGWLAGTAIA